MPDGRENRVRFEGYDTQLRWRPADERPDEGELVGVLRIGGDAGACRFCDNGFDLEPSAAEWNPPRSRDATARDGDRQQESLLARGHEQAHAKLAQPPQLRQPVDDALERDYPVAEARGLLEALFAGQASEALPQRRQRVGGIVSFEPGERASRPLRHTSTRDRPMLGRFADHRPPFRATAEPDVIPATATRIRIRREVANQAHLVECRLQLRPGLAPLDSRKRTKGCFDSGPLAPTREVRAEPRAEVAGAADVEHDVVAIAEEIDTRSGRCPGDERPLPVQPSGSRRGELDDVAHRSRAALLREADQRDEDLRCRLRVGERPVTGLDTRAEEVRKRREADPLDPPLQQPPREPDRVDDRRRNPPAGEQLHLMVEKRHVETGVVGHEHGVACIREEAADC